MANPDKFQALILGSTDHDFPFVVDGICIERQYDIDLLGVNIDCNLSFDKQIANICERANKQLQVIRRFRNLVSCKVKVRLYKAFILPLFQYCSSVWNFCGARNADKLELLNKQVLRVVLNDSTNTYSSLTKKNIMTKIKKIKFKREQLTQAQ